jgi:hypothetical protein
MPVTNGPLGTGNTTVAKADSFIPTLWSDEIIASYKTKLVILDAFRKLSFTGKGDALQIPSPIRGTANVKAPGSPVQIQSATEGFVTLFINKHFEASRVIEDIVEKQAQSSLRQFYTEDIGYQMARVKDVELAKLAAFLNGGTGALTFNAGLIGGDGNTVYTSGAPNATAISDVGLRQAISKMDANDIPMDDRCFIHSAGSRFVLMGLPRFTEQAFVGEVGRGNTIRNGIIGDVYGVQCKMSNNVTTATGGAKANILAHRDAFVTANQIDIRVQTEYQLLYLADLMVADTLFGQLCRRPGTVDVPTGGYALMTPN